MWPGINEYIRNVNNGIMLLGAPDNEENRYQASQVVNLFSDETYGLARIKILLHYGGLERTYPEAYQKLHEIVSKIGELKLVESLETQFHICAVPRRPSFQAQDLKKNAENFLGLQALQARIRDTIYVLQLGLLYFTFKRLWT